MALTLNAAGMTQNLLIQHSVHTANDLSLFSIFRTKLKIWKKSYTLTSATAFFDFADNV